MMFSSIRACTSLWVSGPNGDVSSLLRGSNEDVSFRANGDVWLELQGGNRDVSSNYNRASDVCMNVSHVLDR